jgi:predicted CXXCH cytochrome family protein
MKVPHLFLIAFTSALLIPGSVGCRTDTPTLGPNTQIIEYTPEIDRRESAKACAVCHFQWMDEFRSDRRGTALVAHPLERVVAKPEMCWSCHDGSIVDSRARLMHQGHETGKPPPPEMTIPRDFPLDADGNVQCATCHTPHALQSDRETHVNLFLRAPNENSAACLACHGEMDSGLEAGSHPVGDFDLDLPESLVEAGAKAGFSGNRILCETCHTAHGSATSALLVQNAGDSTLCVTCHTDQMASHLVHGKPVENVVPIRLAMRGAKLGDGGRITCLTCHAIHDNTSGAGTLLVEGGTGLCQACHNDVELGDSAHALMDTPSGFPCEACHGLHGGPGPGCIECHGPGGDSYKPGIQPGVLGHPADGRRMEDGRLLECSPCHGERTHDAFIPDQDSCAECHEPLVRGAAWGAHSIVECLDCHPVHEASALAAAGDPPRNPASRFCLRCHEKGSAAEDVPVVESYEHAGPLVFTPGGQRWTPLGDLLLFGMDGSPVPAGENGELTCQSCHRVHNPSPPEESKDKLRRPDWQRGCAACHDEDALVLYRYFHKPDRLKSLGFDVQ